MSETHEGTPPTATPEEPRTDAEAPETPPAADAAASAEEPREEGQESAPETPAGEEAEEKAGAEPQATVEAGEPGATEAPPGEGAETVAAGEAAAPPGIEEPAEAPPEALGTARESVTAASEGPEPELAEAAGRAAVETEAAAEESSGEAPAGVAGAESAEMSDEEAARAAGAAPPAEAAEGEGEETPLPTDAVSLRLLDALDKGTPILGKVFGWNQGGYHVLIDGLLAFCPKSEIDAGTPRAPKKYIEKTYRFHVIEHRRQGNRFIVSRSKLVEEERAKQAAKVREKLEVGAVLEGRITSLTNFGAFVDLGGGVEGMVHVSELSHRTVGHPKEVVKKGKTVKVKVLKIEEDGKRISLSIKALEPDPWKEFGEKCPRGTPFEGKITGKTDFGVFVEVEPGMEGLIHVSALAPGSSLEDEALEAGKEVKGWVKDVEVKRRRISLSLREVATSDPWRKVEERYPEGEMVTGTVEEIAPFGVFINLEPGLTGLLPNSEMNLPRGTHAGRVYPPGSDVKVQVSRVEPKRKRITLVPEGAKVEGSRTDFREFKKKTQETLGSGMPTLAAAFEKLKQGKDE